MMFFQRTAPGPTIFMSFSWRDGCQQSENDVPSGKVGSIGIVDRVSCVESGSWTLCCTNSVTGGWGWRFSGSWGTSSRCSTASPSQLSGIKDLYYKTPFWYGEFVNSISSTIE